MKWTPEAEAAVRKVPFFVRKRVKARVASDAREAGHTTITLADVKATQARYLKSQASEIKGFQVETCFGPNGCPNRAHAHASTLGTDLEHVLADADLLAHLKAHVDGPLKFHHEFRVALADCPNACSQPQIRDIGIIAACTPAITEAECSGCEACTEACAENAITIQAPDAPCINLDRCVACGQCPNVCETGTLTAGLAGYRVLLGGKLGRHPRLAMELPGIYSADTVLAIVRDCVALYKSRSNRGQRFAALVTPEDVSNLTGRHAPLD